MAKLYVVATPIGNLEDITLRALEVLASVDLIVAEDTRVTRKLLSRYTITKPLFSFHGYSSERAARRIVGYLRDGKNIALVTDAGTPGISDPGERIMKTAILAGFDTAIVSVPGPSALSAMLSISDIDCSEFLFLGFPPRKKGRNTFFKRVCNNDVPVVLFESPHRLLRTLHELQNACGDRYVNIGRELTKIYEEVFRGNLSEAEKYFKQSRVRGEFVIILDIH